MIELLDGSSLESGDYFSTEELYDAGYEKVVENLTYTDSTLTIGTSYWVEADATNPYDADRIAVTYRNDDASQLVIETRNLSAHQFNDEMLDIDEPDHALETDEQPDTVYEITVEQTVEVRAGNDQGAVQRALAAVRNGGAYDTDTTITNKQADEPSGGLSP